MKSIRIGNDIAIRWSIVRDFEKYDLTGKDLEVELLDNYGAKAHISWTTESNAVVILFRGSDQSVCGTYHLTLYENRGELGMVTLDSCDAFKLVSRTQHQTSGGNDCGCVSVSAESLNIMSDIDYAAFSNIEVDDALSATSENPVQNKVVTAALAEKQAAGDYVTVEELSASSASDDEVCDIVSDMDVS